MLTKEFSFDLPDDLIAQEPAKPRDACRLMVLNRSEETIQHERFYDLGKFLKKGDVLVMNDSKVFPARLLFQYEGKAVELFLLKHVFGTEWLAIGKPGKLLQPGISFQIAENFYFEVLAVMPDGQRKIRFKVPEETLDNLIAKYGHTPLPPYIKHTRSTPDDYQTVYAQKKGSVAAPTAGLHFTEPLLEQLRANGIKTVFVTLHVGLGTFQPIKSDEVEKHFMHSEFFEISPQTARELQNARNEKRRIIAVGTTSVRVLESSFDSQSDFQSKFGETSIYIYPGYEWKCVDGLITNFHLPQSTLLLLTCSFGGKDFILKAYQEAIKKGYRFYSFGDAMFIS